MRIGIIGCGYVGQSMASQWKKEGHYICVTTRKLNRLPELQLCANEVHLISPLSLRAFIQSQEVLLITVAPDSSSDYISTYLNLAQQVVNDAKEARALSHILYTSSTQVYGNHRGDWVDENTPIQNLNENGKILYETELILQQLASEKMKVCIFRLGEIYGPGREIEQRLRRMQHQTFSGNGASYTNLIHLTDILNALDFALKHQLQGIYNLCNDFHETRYEFYEKLCQRENLPPVQWDPLRASLHGGNRRVSNSKIKDVGFHFTYSNYFA